MKGKVAVVTGAARGIGRAIALNLAEKGCDIVIADLNLEGWKDYGGEKLSAPSVAEEVRNLGVRSLEITADLTKRSEAVKLIGATIENFGKIDILVNNAGGIAGNAANSWASSVTEEDFKATLDRNLMSAVYCSQEAARYMKEAKSGKIITFGSQAGMLTQDGGYYASYGAAKAGLIMYTKYLAQELAPFNINVNCIAPAVVGTQRLITMGGGPEKYQENAKKIPIGRIAKPEDIARVVGLIISDDAGYVTGQCISVCGGWINF